MRLVLDTSVLVAALRSEQGASRKLVDTVLQGAIRPLVSVPLVLEYEAVLTRQEHLLVAKMELEQAVEIVRAFCIDCVQVHLSKRLRPQLLDPDDEFVLETAVHGRADGIVTLNTSDFLIAARRFGIQVLTPGTALKRIREQ